MISFVGAGGKTSLMFRLARLLALSGLRVLTTTTTKIFVPAPEQSETVLVDSDPLAILRLASSRRTCPPHVTAAACHLADSGKLKGFATEAINIFNNSELFDWILVEADGAAGRSLKAPAEHEPVIPSCTTNLVAVAGLDVLGKPLSEDVVFRSELAGRLMGIEQGEVISETALARLFLDPAGSFKGIPAASRRIIFLNKADAPDRLAAAARIAELLRHSGQNVAEALLAGQALERIAVHSLHDLAPAP